MKTRFRKSFARDLRKLDDTAVLKKIKVVIEDLETAQHLRELKNINK